MTGIRALLGLCIAMGVLIVAGTTALVAVVVHRLAHGHASSGAETAIAAEHAPARAVPERAILDEPPGSHVVAVVRDGDHSLVLVLSGGGRADRVVVWDVPDGRPLQTITVGTVPAGAP